VKKSGVEALYITVKMIAKNVTY